MKRIVEETFANKSIRYRVETNRIFGLISCKWHTDTFYDGERDITFDAVFSTLDEAYSYSRLGLVRKGGPCEVVSRKIIYY